MSYKGNNPWKELNRIKDEKLVACQVKGCNQNTRSKACETDVEFYINKKTAFEVLFNDKGDVNGDSRVSIIIKKTSIYQLVSKFIVV